MYTAKYLRSSILPKKQKQQQQQQPSTKQNDSEVEEKLSKQQQENEYDLNIDMIEKLPTPYGLVRSGVAPDHPE
eukprot:12667857-Ditylum_brightwellii.AAC.1